MWVFSACTFALLLLSIAFGIVSEGYRGTDLEPQTPRSEQMEWRYWWISEALFVGAVACFIVAVRNK